MASGPIAERNQGKLNLINSKIYLNSMNFSAILIQLILSAFLIILDATIYVGGLDEKVTETLLWELFVQAGPVGKLIKFNDMKRL